MCFPEVWVGGEESNPNHLGILEAQRLTSVRGVELGKLGPATKSEWREDARAFLANCLLEAE